MKQKYFTASQVAAMCGMTPDGVRKARQRGKFPHAKKIKNVDGIVWYRLTRHDVREFLLFEKDVALEEVE
jgi:hypothetical protein